MPYPEPSIYDCGAPWNEMDAIDDDGNEVIVCGCSRCQRSRREAARDYEWDYDEPMEWERAA